MTFVLYEIGEHFSQCVFLMKIDIGGTGRLNRKNAIFPIRRRSFAF